MKIPPLQAADRPFHIIVTDKLKINVIKILTIKKQHAIVQSKDEINKITLESEEQKNCMGGQCFLRKGAESWQKLQY